MIVIQISAKFNMNLSIVKPTEIIWGSTHL